MKSLPNNFAFFRDGIGWSMEPSISLYRNTFFNTPVFTSERAIRILGKEILTHIIEFIRTKAEENAGIESFQAVFDKKGRFPSLYIIEEGSDGDLGVGVTQKTEKATSVVLILKKEYFTYTSRCEADWLGLRKLVN